MKLNDLLVPKTMLIGYVNEKSNHGRYSNSVKSEDVYFEFTEIKNGKPGALIPLSDKAASLLSKSLATSSRTEVGGIVPSNLIYFAFKSGAANLIWYTKPCLKTLKYNIDDKYSFKTSRINVPWLIWHYSSSTLNLYASAKKPTLKSNLLRAPFPNITDGNVCLGAGTKILDKEFVEFSKLMNTVEAAFYGTNFTHVSSNAIEGNLITVHKVLDKSKKPFPVELLKFANVNIQCLIDGTTFENEDDEDEVDEDDE